MEKVVEGGGTSVVFRPFADAQRPPRSKKSKPDPALCAGMPLPMHLRQSFPQHLTGKPIDDLDPFYQNKNTFVVIGGHWVIYRFNAEKSLFMFSAASRVRQAAITLTTNAFAHYLTFFVILVYAFFHTDYESNRLYSARPFFWAFFLVEVVVKVVAYGFLLKSLTYLRYPWNWLDFLATLSQFTSILGVGSFAPIRIIRLVNFFTESRLLFASSCNVLFKMRDVVIYAVFSIFFWSITFMLMYGTMLTSRCVMNGEVLLSELGHGDGMLCGNASGSLSCPEGSVCHLSVGLNPNYGYTNFDSFFWAALSILRVMTRDWWDGLMAQVQATTSPYCLVVFLFVVIYGCYVLKIFVAAHVFINHGRMLDVLEGKKNSGEKPQVEDTEKEKSDVDEKDTALVDVPFADDVTTHYKRDLDKSKEEPEIVILSNCDSTGSEKKDTDKEDGVHRESGNPLPDCCSPFLDFICTWQCCSCCTTMQEFLSRIVLHRCFDAFICFTIIINTLAMAMDHHNMSSVVERFLYSVNYVVLLTYTVEAVLKILALSPRRYFKDSWCRFEFTIVFLALLELGLENVSGLSILRAVAILRVCRIGKFYRHFNALLSVGFARFFVLFVFVISFAILGQFLFQFSYMLNVGLFERGEMPRLHFIDLTHSIFIVIRLLCGAWIDSFWDCMLVVGYSCVPFYLLAVILGNLLILNVFVSLVMMAFAETHDLCEIESEANDKEEQNDPSPFTSFGDAVRRLCSFRSCRGRGSEKVPSAKSEEHLCEVTLEGDVKLTDLTVTVDSDEVAAECCPAVCYSWFPFCGSPSTSPTVVTQTSFWTNWQIFRNRLLAILRTWSFHAIVTTFVLVTCLVPYSQVRNEAGLVGVFNSVVFVGFSLELLLKFLAVGCKTYFTIGWNRFDFVVTVLHLCSCLFGSSLGRIGSYFYALRILKLFSYHERLRVVVGSVLFRFSYVANAIFASFLVWFLCALVGVQLFAGKFFKCVDFDGERLPSIIVNHLFECHDTNFTWINSEINFDNIANAFVALLQVASMHGETSVMFDAMDSRGINMQPDRDANVFGFIYFTILFYFGVLCCYAFVFTSFLKKINVQKQNEGGYIDTVMTANQKVVYGDKRKTLFKRPLATMPEPTSSVRKSVYRLVTSQKFNLTIFVILVFNALTMAIDHSLSSVRMYLALSYIRAIFATVFFIEIILKWFAFGRSFFSNPWNVFDFCIIMPLPVDLFYAEFASAYFVSPEAIYLLIVLRLIRYIKCLRRVFIVLRVWFPVFLNVGFLLFVVAFFYASAGVGQFRNSPFTAGIDELYNFNSIGSALSVMIQIAFGGAWDLIYSGLMYAEHYHTPGHSFQVSAFVLSFLAVTFLVLVQVGSVLLLECYECLARKRHLGITDEDLENFCATWRVFDPYGRGSIPYDLLSDLLNTLASPLKSEQPNDDTIAVLAIPVSKDNQVAFDDVLQSLLRRLDTVGKFYHVGGHESDKCDTARRQQDKEEDEEVVEEESQRRGQ